MKESSEDRESERLEAAERPEAAERLEAAEHLDRALQVTTPKAWLALLALTFMLTAFVGWSILGEVTSHIRAEGIILSRDGTVFDAVSPAGGQLARIVPAVGDTVAEGNIVAEVFDAETMERHTGAVNLVQERSRVLLDREAEEKAENEFADRNVARQRARLDELQRTSSELVRITQERLENDRAMLERGFTNRTVVEQSERALEEARISLFDVLRRRDDLDFDDLRRRNELRSRVVQAEAELAEAKRQVKEVAALIDTWRIPAPVSGRVIEIKAQPGDSLDPGQSVLGIETGGEGLDVLFYVSAANGKRIEAGMKALVSPANVRREEFGLMIGTVERLSEFPASLDGMVAVLRNQDLAKTLSHGGAPYPGRVMLTPDPSNSNGFSWTSPQAAHVSVRSGTLAEVEVEVSKRPPIELIVPWIKEKFSR